MLHKLLKQYVLVDKEKVIIFSGFDQTLNLCEDLLQIIRRRSPEFEYVRIDGSTPSAWRNLAIHLFNTDSRYMVFLISIRAGGEGLNLASASTVVFLDEDWNPQVMRQAEARVHRIGQAKPVSIFKMYSRGTVEEQMVGRIAKKSYLAAKVTDNMQSPGCPDVFSDVSIQDAGDGDSFNPSIAALASLMRRRDLISKGHVDTRHLLSMDWQTLLEHCTEADWKEHDSADSITEEEERAWLKEREHIKTNVFNGCTIQKAPRKFDEEVILELPRADRRIGKQTTVMIDGFPVTKENLASDVAPDSRKSSNTKAKKWILHDEVSIPDLCLAITDTASVALSAAEWEALDANSVLDPSIRAASRPPPTSPQRMPSPCLCVRIIIAQVATEVPRKLDNYCTAAVLVQMPIARTVWTGPTPSSLEWISMSTLRSLSIARSASNVLPAI